MKTSNYFYQVVIILVLLSMRSWAGHEVGNGGVILECLSRDIKSYIPLDHYEAQAQYNFTLDLGPNAMNVEDKINYVFNRMLQKNINRVELYKNWFGTFEEEIEFVYGEPLPVLADIGEAQIPTNCKPVQLIIQRSSEKFKKIYQIQGDIWKILDSEAKAGMILHELIYRELFYGSSKHTDSRVTRYLNGLFSSKEYENKTDEELFQLFSDIKVRDIDLKGSIPVLTTCEYPFKSKVIPSYHEIDINCLGDSNKFFKIYGDKVKLVEGSYRSMTLSRSSVSLFKFSFDEEFISIDNGIVAVEALHPHDNEVSINANCHKKSGIGMIFPATIKPKSTDCEIEIFAKSSSPSASIAEGYWNFDVDTLGYNNTTLIIRNGLYINKDGAPYFGVEDDSGSYNAVIYGMFKLKNGRYHFNGEWIEFKKLICSTRWYGFNFDTIDLEIDKKAFVGPNYSFTASGTLKIGFHYGDLKSIVLINNNPKQMVNLFGLNWEINQVEFSDDRNIDYIIVLNENCVKVSNTVEGEACIGETVSYKNTYNGSILRSRLMKDVTQFWFDAQGVKRFKTIEKNTSVYFDQYGNIIRF